jgi:hypothetical protein
MAESPRRADLRLTITACDPYTALAGELAAKFAEYSGANAEAASRLRTDVEALAGTFAGARDIELTMESRDHRVTVTATAGNRRESATCSVLHPPSSV